MNPEPNTKTPEETEVLVVGGGPVGMFAALRLSQLGRRCIIVEQNNYTTIHPKMEYSSHRTMEIYRRIGLLDHVRPKGVPESYGFTELFSTGIGGRNVNVARIDRPSPAALRKSWAMSNDGSHPLEPHMRQSQIIFEAILKQIVQNDPLIQDYWGYTFQSLIESGEGVLSTIHDASGRSISISSRYVIGCDGAGSKVRSSANIQSPRQSLPLNLAYVHFRSSDKAKIQSFGDFWHMTIITGVVVVAQDEVDTYTLHRVIPPGTDYQIEDPEKFIHESIGGVGGPSDIKVDEILVTGKWQADMSIASSFRSSNGRVLLAGDAAHQLTPAGGHGMNSGIQDAYDLTWKLAAVLDGWGGDGLLDSYNKERRPVAELNTFMVEKAVVEVVIPWTTKGQEVGFDNLISETEEGQVARSTLRDAILPGHWIHEQTGTVMGYRYNGSPVIIPDRSIQEPPTSITEYIPSTWPGARAPHVFLSDGKTSIFDMYGPDFNIVDFTTAGELSRSFVTVAKSLGIPMTAIHLPQEPHCRNIWERDVVLIRPDGFVAWRCASKDVGLHDNEIKSIMLSVTGQTSSVSANSS